MARRGRPRGSTSAPDQARLEEIYAAAGRVFEQKGYDNTSIEDVAREVGLLKGSLYYYIDKKENLLHGVVAGPVREILESARGVLASAAAPPDKLRQFVLNHLDCFERNRVRYFVFLQEKSLHQGDESVVAQLGKRYEQLLIDLIAEGVQRGAFRADLNPKVAAFAVLGMCNWLHRWYREGGDLSLRQVADQFLIVLMQGFLAPGGAPPDGAAFP